jgi:hypothetical protein
MPNTAPVENNTHARQARPPSLPIHRLRQNDSSKCSGRISARVRVRKIPAPLIKGPTLRQNPSHGREHPKSTDDCSTRFRARLGAGFRCSPRRAHVSCRPLPGHRIVGAVLFGLGISPGLAAASVDDRFDSGIGIAHLAGNKCRWSDRQTGIHHRCAGISPLFAGHDHVLRGEFAPAVTGLRITAVFVAAGIKTA